MGKRKFSYVVYKLTFPNGKSYIGLDVGAGGHSMRYFGSWNNELVEKDFSREQLADFTIRKQFLFESDEKQEIRKMENKLIVEHKTNNPDVGYNRNPKFRRAV